MADDGVFIGLGSNLGDREAHLEGAVAALASSAGVELLAASRVYETAPVGPPPQGFYLNAVLRLRTSLAPRALLELQLEIETRAGRERGVRDMARTLDLDLLLFGALVVESEGLGPARGRWPARLEDSGGQGAHREGHVPLQR